MHERRIYSFLTLILTAIIFVCGLPAFSQQMPSKAKSMAMPDMAALLEKLRANQDKIEAIEKNYICTKTDDQFELDKSGKKKDEEIRQYDFYYDGDIPVQRLVAKDGKPLSESEQKKEDERVKKSVAKAKEREAKNEEDSGKRQVTLGIATFLKVSELSNARKEQYKGHEVLAVDFAPNPTYKPKNRNEDIAHKISGTLWIDEEALQVVKLEAKLVQGMKIWGGLLASIKPGSSLVFEQERVNNEIWLPSGYVIDFSARILFSGKRGEVIGTYTNYRKFRVDTVIKPVEAPTEPKP